MISRNKSFILTIVLMVFTRDLAAQKIRITSTVDNTRRITLSGHLRAGAVPANDRGEADASLQIPDLSLELRPSATQQADLDALLQRQQDASSPDFHRWLTPEQYADRFGVAQADIDTLVAWLQSQNLSGISVARGRNAISLRGPVRSVEHAFGTEIHHYVVNGEPHFANATEPSIPAAFAGLIGEVRGLNDFRTKARNLKKTIRARPAYTDANFCANFCLAPDDFATIYDITPLYTAGIDGTGETIAVIGQTRINLPDIAQFRAFFNLPVNTPQTMLVPGKSDPGVSEDDLGEANLDVEWAGVTGRNAKILYVFSLNAADAAQYAVDQNLAPVITMSYGNCEAAEGIEELTMRIWAQQANSQGQTWVAAAGDYGGGDCVANIGAPVSVIDSAAVDVPAAIPEVTGVGGSVFNEGTGTYWSTTNTSNRASALKYIPEAVWNDSVVAQVPTAGGGGLSMFFAKPSWQPSFGIPIDIWRGVPDISLNGSGFHDPYLINPSTFNAMTGLFVNTPLTAVSQLWEVGGTSAGAPSMAGIVALLNQYAVKNGYQAQPGLGNINPLLYAIAKSAPGAFHDITNGSNVVDPCLTTLDSSCTNTMVGYTAKAGYDLASGLGSPDVNNLALAWHQASAATRSNTTLSLTSTPSTITLSGSAVVTAKVLATNGGTPTGTVTFSLGSTALGSAVTVSGGSASLTVNASQLVAGMNTISAQYSGDSNYNSSTAAAVVTVSASKLTPGLTVTTSLSSVASGGAVVLHAAVTGGGVAPTGTVTFSAGSTSLGAATLSGSGAALTVNDCQLSTGANTISAQYGGDTTYVSASATGSVTVPAVLTLTGATNAASFQQVYAPGMIMAIFGCNMGPAAQPAQGSPLPTSLGGVTVTINGVAAPFYFVAPGQANIQIPYQTPANATSTLAVTYNGQSASLPLAVAAAAPGIFDDPANGNAVPDGTAKIGDFVTLFITGDGAAYPAPTTGTTPSSNVLPVPTQSVSLTVGGMQIAQPLPFVGIPGWSIGVTQINFQVPAGLAPGTRQIVVTVGGVASAAVNLTVTE